MSYSDSDSKKKQKQTYNTVTNIFEAQALNVTFDTDVVAIPAVALQLYIWFGKRLASF